MLTLNVKDVLKKIPEFDYLLYFRNKNNNLSNHNNNYNNMLISTFFQKKLNETQCKILHDKGIITKIFREFKLLDLRGKSFRLIL